MRRRTKTAAALGMLLLAAAPAAYAQDSRPRQADPERQLAMLTERLDLTEEQATQVKQILSEQREKARESMQSKQGDRDAMRAEMEKQREATHARLAEVLTEAQMAEWKKMEQEAMRERRRGGP